MRSKGWKDSGAIPSPACSKRSPIFSKSLAVFQRLPDRDTISVGSKGVRYGGSVGTGAWPELAERIRGFRKAEPNSSFWIVYEGISAAHDGDRKVAMFADSVLQVIAKPGGDKRYGEMPLPLSLYHRAEIASLLGDRDRAIGLLGDAFANRLRYNTYVHANQAFASIRNDPRYVRLMAPRD